MAGTPRAVNTVSARPSEARCRYSARPSRRRPLSRSYGAARPASRRSGSLRLASGTTLRTARPTRTRRPMVHHCSGSDSMIASGGVTRGSSSGEVDGPVTGVSMTVTCTRAGDAASRPRCSPRCHCRPRNQTGSCTRARRAARTAAGSCGLWIASRRRWRSKRYGISGLPARHLNARPPAARRGGVTRPLRPGRRRSPSAPGPGCGSRRRCRRARTVSEPRRRTGGTARMIACGALAVGASWGKATALICSVLGTVSAKRSITATATRPGVVGAGRLGSTPGGPNAATSRDGRTTSVSDGGGGTVCHGSPGRFDQARSGRPPATMRWSSCTASRRASAGRTGATVSSQSGSSRGAEPDDAGSLRTPVKAAAGKRENTGSAPSGATSAAMADAITDTAAPSSVAGASATRRSRTSAARRTRSASSPTVGSATSATSGVMPQRAIRPIVARRRAAVALAAVAARASAAAATAAARTAA